MLRKSLRHIVVKIRNCLFFVVFVAFLIVVYTKNIRRGEIVTKIHKSAHKYVDFKPQDETKLQINTIKRYIDKHNTEERILNVEFFGPIDPNAPIFVVFVDKFTLNLKYLLVSLTNLSGIEDALIIFSHSVYDENVNNLIKTIDFARVLQIFYPYSRQVYPNEFPEFQEGDCPHNMHIKTAQSINCTGAGTPDIHGRYRDPHLAQMKHYWWWTLNKVFDNLSILKDHKGIFTFLEDDVFLMEDFIYMNLKMKSIGDLITKCEMISLFSPIFKFSYFHNVSTYTVELTTWDPKYYTTVLSFDSSVWSSIAAHYYLFCYIDDYSWARSLYYLSLNRKDGGRFKVMSSIMPRAFKTSSSALYDKILDHEMTNTIHRILDMQERNKVNLYPPYLEVYLNIELDDDDFVIFDYFDNNGGWNDPRDRNMCTNITTNKIKKVIMDMAHEFHQYDLARSN